MPFRLAGQPGSELVSIMQSTLVATGGKGSNPKTTLYVGGLDESVNDAILHSAFIPFGDIKDVNIPLDHSKGTHRGELELHVTMLQW
jgi:hypothetical protein